MTQNSSEHKQEQTNQTHLSPHTHTHTNTLSMLLWSLPRTVCVLSACVCLAVTYEDDDIEVNYADTYYNEITEEDSPVRECCPVSVCPYVCL